MNIEEFYNSPDFELQPIKSKIPNIKFEFVSDESITGSLLFTEPKRKQYTNQKAQIINIDKNFKNQPLF